MHCAKIALFSLLLLLLPACSDDSSSENPQQDQGVSQHDSQGGEGGLSDGSGNSDGSAPATGCACAADEVCDSVQGCIPYPGTSEGESFAELTLIAQHTLLDTSIIGNVGEAKAMITPHDPLPADSRETFSTDEGEHCWRETNSDWPIWLGGEGYWPSTPGLGGGNITFQVAGGPSSIVLEEIPLDDPYGFGYNHLDVPPALEDDTTVYMDYFDLSNVPGGASFQVELAGGDDIGATTFSGGAIPNDFTITAPAVESGTPQVSIAQDVQVSWTPAQSGAMMEIRFLQTLASYSTLVRCQVDDDGEALIPAAAFNTFSPAPDNVALQLRRQVISQSMGVTTSGAPLHVFLKGMQMRIGSLQLTP